MDSNYFPDLNKRYNGTFVCMRNVSSGQRLVGVVSRVHEHSAAVELETEVEILVLPLRDWEIEPVPRAHVFDHLGMTYCFCRVPARQYRKGLCEDNTSIFTPLASVLQNIPRVIFGPKVNNKFANMWKKKAMESLFFPVYTQSLRGAIHKLETDDDIASTSINADHWLSYNPKSSGYLLWRRATPLAILDRGANDLSLISSLHYQEVHDLLSRTGDYSYVVSQI